MLQRQFKQVSSANWQLLECFKDNLSKCHQRSDYYLLECFKWLTISKQVSSANCNLSKCHQRTTTWMLQRQFKQVSSAKWLSVISELTTTWMLQRQFKQVSLTITWMLQRHFKVSSAKWLLLECFKDNLSKCHQRQFKVTNYLNASKTITI